MMENTKGPGICILCDDDLHASKMRLLRGQIEFLCDENRELRAEIKRLREQALRQALECKTCTGLSTEYKKD